MSDYEVMRFVDRSAEIGEGCTLGFGVVIEAGARLGLGCSVGHHAVIHAGVQLGAGCRVEDHAVLGRQPRPAPTSTVKVPKALPPLVIGDETSIGTGAVVYTRHDHWQRSVSIGDLAFVREQVQIGDRVIVGTHVTVENAVSIGSGVKIQTGAYITAWTTIEADCFIAPVRGHHQRQLHGPHRAALRRARRRS
ncbi:MAG: DapH/DapD/GlmU-related protein [Anaerolineae bacterium]